MPAVSRSPARRPMPCRPLLAHAVCGWCGCGRRPGTTRRTGNRCGRPAARRSYRCRERRARQRSPRPSSCACTQRQGIGCFAPGLSWGLGLRERPAECADRDDAVEALLDCVGLNKARSRSADLVRWVAAVTAAEIAREEPLDRAYVGNSIRSAIQSVSFVREQEILRVMIARTKR